MYNLLMQNILTIILGVGLVVAIFALLRKKETPEKQDDTGLRLLLEQMNNLSRTVDERLGESSKIVHESLHRQFGESQRLIKDITEELAHVKDTGRRVEGFAEQLQNLQDILRNPKQRGILGEYYLETLLKNVLPTGSYQTQYPFKDGSIVDAVVFVKDKIIPIDSKFSLENYNRLVEEKDPAEKAKLQKTFENDLKNRILETSKYIQPQQDTMDFAFMFIPHEAIYYDLILGRVGASEENLIQRAAAKYKVIIVSPTSFLAYLQTVLQGLNAMKIEEKAKDIIVNVVKLGEHLKRYDEYHSKLGTSLSTVVNHYTNSNKELGKIDKDIIKLTGEKVGFELPPVDLPDIG